MVKTRNGDSDEATAFVEAMRDVVPLKIGGPARVAPGPAPSSPARRAASRLARLNAAWGAPALTEERGVSTISVEGEGETWSARADGVDRRLVRKLATGKIPVEGRLDLHGHSRRDALAALERFFVAARANGARALLVIHGRGLHSGDDGPALRDAVRDFVTVGPAAGEVLACSSAPSSLGGAGATVVWLRRANS